jgi:hypothetical protein
MTTVKEQMEMKDKVLHGLELMYERLIISKKKNNSPMIVMKDGKVTAVDPHDMPATVTYERGELK